MARWARFSAVNLAFAYVGFSLAVLALFAIPLGVGWRRIVDDSQIELLQAEANRMQAVFDAGGAKALAATIQAQVGNRLMGEKVVLLADAALAPLAGNLVAWPAGIGAPPGVYKVSIKLGDEKAGKAIQATLVHTLLPDGLHLLSGCDVTRFSRLEAFFWYGLGGAGAIVLVVGVLGGLIIRRALLSEVQDLSRTAAAIVEGDLSQRLPTHAGRQEFDVLATTLNHMLDRIEQLVHGVRNVSNAIAHDLRTPLAELRSRLEELTVVRPAADETFAEIDAAVADVDRVLDLFNALLRLAEIDTGARRSGFVVVDLVDLASRATEFYQPVAELKHVALSFMAGGEEVMVLGDRLMLAQAIGNLIDNAVKFARSEGSIVVSVGPVSGETVDVTVADDGPGIPEAELALVTGRFYRGDASRGTPGVGLGLSLVEAVATLHGGALRLASNQPGLQATLRVAHKPQTAPSEFVKRSAPPENHSHS